MITNIAFIGNIFAIGTNLFKIALRALANNKLRAFLTMLGIIIGVASVITMLAIGQGSKKSIQAQISEMGSNMIMIHPGADMRGGVRQDPSAMQTLKLTDYEALRNETNFLAAVSPNVSSSGQLIAGNNNYPSSVSGVGTDYLEIRQLTVENGTMFTETDIQTSAKVICNIVLSIGKCTCTAKSAHDRTAITSHAALDLCAVYRTFSSLKLMSSLKHCNLEIRSLLCQLICRKYSSWSCSNNYHVILHALALQFNFIIFINL